MPREPGRNDPCPCGSGRKYKHCHLRTEPRTEPRTETSDEDSGAYTSNDRSQALTKLTRFVTRDEFRDDWQLAVDVLWASAAQVTTRDELDHLLAGETGRFPLFSFYAFDFEVESGQTLLSVFLDKHGATLRAGERDYLEAMRSSHVRLYEIRHVRPNDGFDLRDLLTGHDQFVSERAATTQLVQWDIIGARVINGGHGAPVFDDIPYVFPASEKESLVKLLRLAQREVSKGPLAGDEVAFFRRIVVAIHAMWVERVVLPQTRVPQLSTIDGEPMVFAKAVFDVRDAKRLRAALHDSPETDEDSADNRFVWLDVANDAGRVLGTFEITGSRLTFEAFSEERATRARAFLERIAGDAVTHRATRLEDVARTVARQREQGGSRRPAKHRDEIPPDVQATLVLGMLEQHYRKWIDEPVPALGNRTPRHAARLKTVQPKVVELLKTMESHAARDRLEGRPAYDFGWMWDELGLDRA